jgi:hypothetical protein
MNGECYYAISMFKTTIKKLLLASYNWLAALTLIVHCMYCESLVTCDWGVSAKINP